MDSFKKDLFGQYIEKKKASLYIYVTFSCFCNQL